MIATQSATARGAGWISPHRRLLAGSSGALTAVVVVGLGARAFGHPLGKRLAPFLITWFPAVGWPALAAVVVGAAIVATAPRALALHRVPFAVALFAGALAEALAVNGARSGPFGWWQIFKIGPGGSFEAINEYLPGLPALARGTGPFLHRFAQLVPTLPQNVAAHPPGLLVSLHALGLATPERMAAVCIVAAAAVAPLTYLLARALCEERVARTAGMLAAVCPCLVLFGATSADAVYAALGTGAAALLAGSSWRGRAAGATLLGIAGVFSWLLLAIGAWSTLVALRREGPRRAAIVAALCAGGVLAVQGALAARYGYDPIAALRATDAVYRASAARVRPYAFWVFGSPAAWALIVGPPIALAAATGARLRRPAAMALLGVVAIAALSGYSKAETERIWLPFAPLACVAAAEAGLGGGRLRAVLGLLLAQALAIELLFNTVW